MACRAGRCVWRPPSLHEILFVPYDVHLHFLLFTCFSWKILSYLNQIHPNSKRSALLALKWKELSAVSRKFFWSVEIEQPLLVAKLTRAEINGLQLVAVCGGRRASMKFSLFHMMSISTSCSSHVSFERSSHAWTNSELICKQANEVRAMWDAQHKGAMETSLSPWMRSLREIIRFVLENYMPIWDWGVSRAAACTICSSQFLLQDAWNLGLVRLRTWPASASNMQKTAGGWRHRIASPRRAIKPQHSETGIILSNVVM